MESGSPQCTPIRLTGLAVRKPKRKHCNIVGFSHVTCTCTCGSSSGVAPYDEQHGTRFPLVRYRAEIPKRPKEHCLVAHVDARCIAGLGLLDLRARRREAFSGLLIGPGSRR